MKGNFVRFPNEYLGVTIDKDLEMVSHVDNMYEKANSKLGILSKIHRYITEETAVKLYKTMIRPYLEYVDFVIESSTKKKIDRIDNLQRKALRRFEYCNNPEDRQTYDELGCKYNVEKLSVRRKRSLLRMINIESKDSNDIKKDSHGMNLRSSKHIFNSKRDIYVQKIKVQIIHFQFYSLLSYQTLVKSVTLFTPLIALIFSFHLVYSMCLYVNPFAAGPI